MSVNLLGFIAAALSVTVFFAAYRGLRNRPSAVRPVLLLVFSVLSLPSLLFAVYYLHVLPETEWFYTLRSWTGSEFLVLFPGAAAGIAATFLPRFLLGFPLFGLLLLGLIPYLKPLLGPLDYGAFQDKWMGNACLQSTSSTCGPASVASALAVLGKRLSEREVATQAYSYAGGTEAWYLARLVRRQGFSPRFVFAQDVLPASFPAVIGVRIGGMGHFIVLLERSDGHVTFIDPLSGEERLTEDVFRKRYTLTGFQMTIARN